MVLSSTAAVTWQMNDRRMRMPVIKLEILSNGYIWYTFSSHSTDGPFTKKGEAAHAEQRRYNLASCNSPNPILTVSHSVSMPMQGQRM